MDANHFDRLTRALSEARERRGLLGLLAALPVWGGLFALLDAEDSDAKGRRRRRKKRHKHGKGRRRKHKKNKKPCKPQSKTTTCAGKCGDVLNNCKQTVDCGACVCDPACPVCQTCDATTGECVPSDNGDPCDACITGSTCNNGTCSGGSPVVCNSPNECQDGPGACDPDNGECSYPPKSDGTRCGNKCTQACTAGVCGAGTPVTCPAGECQTAETCDPSTGLCSNPTDKPNGTECSTGRCCNGICPGPPLCLGRDECCGPVNPEPCFSDCCSALATDTGSGTCPFVCSVSDVEQGCGSDSDCIQGTICVCGTCCGPTGFDCGNGGSFDCCSHVCGPGFVCV